MTTSNDSNSSPVATADQASSNGIQRPPAPPQGRFGLRGFDALKVRGFQYFAVSTALQMGAESMQLLANGWYAYKLTGSTAILGLTLLAQAIPQIFLSVVGGAVSDRLPRRTIWMVCVIASGVLSGWIAVSILLGTITWVDLVIRSFFFGCIVAFRMPARQGTIGDLVGKERLMSAVSMSQAIINVMQFVGPAVSGFVIGLFGIEWAYLIVTALFWLAALCLIPMPYQHRGQAKKGSRGSLFGNMRDGIKYAVQTPNIAAVLGLTLLGTMCAFPYTSLLPAFAEDILKIGPAQLGILASLSGVGALSGSIALTMASPKSRGLLFMRVGMFTGIGLVVFCISSSYLLSCFIVVLVGIGQSVRHTLSSTLLQTYTDDAYIGRVLSIQLTQNGLTSLSSFFVALYAEAIGVRWAIMTTSVLLVVISGLYFVFSTRLRRLA